MWTLGALGNSRGDQAHLGQWTSLKFGDAPKVLCSVSINLLPSHVEETHNTRANNLEEGTRKEQGN